MSYIVVLLWHKLVSHCSTLNLQSSNNKKLQLNLAQNWKLELTTLMVGFFQFLQNLVGWEEPKRKLLAVCHLSLCRHTNKTDRLQCTAQSNMEHNLWYTKDISLLTTGKDLALKVTLILLCYETAHLYTSTGKLLSPVCQGMHKGDVCMLVCVPACIPACTACICVCMLATQHVCF